MKNKVIFCDILLCVLLFSFLFGMGATVLLTPPKSFSERENRNLSQFPTLSLSSLSSGNFARTLGDFYSDQLPLRQELTSLYSIAELSLGKRECNGVAVCEDGVLIQLPPRQESENCLRDNLLAIDGLRERLGEKAAVMIAPRSSDVFADYLPSALAALGKATLEEIGCELGISLLSLIKESGAPQEYYYRTDHHWTSKGAYEAYKLLSSPLGYSARGESFFEKEIASSDFLGTSFSKSLLPLSAAKPDTLTLYRYDGDGDLRVTVRGDTEQAAGLYDFSTLSHYDKYRVFLGGNYPHISIYTPHESREKLLLIKDSFANSLIPFLSLHFDIEAIDPRYATPSALRTLCESESFDRVLLLCSADTLASESAIGRFISILK